MKQTIKRKALVAGAITGGLAGASHAATVQITLTGNMISFNGGNQLVADITGDGTDDVIFNNDLLGSFVAAININGQRAHASYPLVTTYINTYSGSIRNTFNKFNADAQFANGGVGTPASIGLSDRNIKYLNPVIFTDSRINGGLPTDGYLEVNSFAAGQGANSVTLTRFVFDDASTTRPTGVLTTTQYTEAVLIPEPSSLTLLALGAGGLLARRNRKKAA